MILTLNLTGCPGNDSAPEILDEDTFVACYSEMLILGERFRSDSRQYHSRIDSLFAARGTTAGAVRRTLTWYAEDAGRWEDINNKIIVRMERQLEELRRTAAD